MFLNSVCASLGDRLIIYQTHYKRCLANNCSSEDKLNTFLSKQSRWHYWLNWNCTEECRYQSQWKTIEELKFHNVKDIPQFHGKVMSSIERIAVTYLSIYSGRSIGFWAFKNQLLLCFPFSTCCPTCTDGLTIVSVLVV